MKKNRILIFCLLILSALAIVIYNKLKEQKDIIESIKFGQKGLAHITNEYLENIQNKF